MRMLILAALTASLCAQELVTGPAKPPYMSDVKDVQAKTVVSIDAITAKLAAAEQETRLAKLEGLVLREQIAAQQLEKIRADQQALYLETCKAAGIDPDPKMCQIDLNAKTVTKREAPKIDAKKQP